MWLDIQFDQRCIFFTEKKENHADDNFLFFLRIDRRVLSDVILILRNYEGFNSM